MFFPGGTCRSTVIFALKALFRNVSAATMGMMAIMMPFFFFAMYERNGLPRTAQQSIPFERMFPDGICRVHDGFYTKTIQFQDINYQLAQQEDKTTIFEEWCSFLNFFDSSVKFELSFINQSTDAESFEKSIRIAPRRDGFNSVRTEYSSMLKRQLA